MQEQGWQGIAPATGWLAVFVRENGSIYTERVALWAWHRDIDVDGTIYDRAEGVLGRRSMEEVQYADDSDHFVGYIHESEDIKSYGPAIAEVLERLERRRRGGEG